MIRMIYLIACTIVLVCIGLLDIAIIAYSQPAVDPRPLAAVCAYNSSPPTATSGTFILVQCDSTGKLAVH